ncbi:hypothetical protein LSH36_69g02001 [Paralvinella palmiformis]|uniref:Uncharacterized protein n=1 Tax=Paralvinella palmiformis TaxID=53620 RepID=A0AAD9K3G7_9ANNE|nr:hypothetical protein LSH36_69g02001 [Paralvinella palmiformis]
MRAEIFLFHSSSGNNTHPSGLQWTGSVATSKHAATAAHQRAAHQEAPTTILRGATEAPSNPLPGLCS